MMRFVLAMLAALAVGPTAGATSLDPAASIAITDFAFHIEERLIGGMHVLTPSGVIGQWSRATPDQPDWLDLVLRDTERSFSELLGVSLLRTNRRHGSFPPASDMVGELPLSSRQRAFREGGYDAIVELRAWISTPGPTAEDGFGRGLKLATRPTMVLKARVVRSDGAVLWRNRVKVRHQRPLRQTAASVAYGTYVTHWETLPTAEIVELYRRALTALTRSRPAESP